MTAGRPFARILVTGCGGDIGQSLGRILRTRAETAHLAGCDIHADHAGAAFFETCAVVPRADDAAYLDALAGLVEREQIDLVVPGSEAEIGRLTEDGLRAVAGAPLLMANPLAVRTGLDKLATVRKLAALGLDVPWTSLVGESEPKALPCLLKKRRGQGGKDLVQVTSPALVAHHAAERPGDLWQELLLPDDEEYTCGLYRTRKGETRCLALRRRLQGSLTGSGVVVDDPDITAYLQAIAEGLELAGSINVQLRRTARGPVAFEINPRFSSTVLFRHRLGFRDLLWSLADAAGEDPGPYEPPAPGTRFYRTSDEIVVPPEPRA